MTNNKKKIAAGGTGGIEQGSRSCAGKLRGKPSREAFVEGNGRLLSLASASPKIVGDGGEFFLAESGELVDEVALPNVLLCF